MYIVFIPKGRLGNAIFRYLASAILCIKYGATYSMKPVSRKGTVVVTEQMFNACVSTHDKINLSDKNYILTEFYQRDMVYRENKQLILDYINSNDDHFVVTDGITPGDGNQETFKMRDIISTPSQLQNKYDLVFHVRLGDKVHLQNTIGIAKLCSLIEQMSNDEMVISICKNGRLAIVCQQPCTEYEINFVDALKKKIYGTFSKNKSMSITLNIESNDTLTDYYIMLSAKVLVASMSTLSWCAAFFSTTIEKCFMPNHYPKLTNDYCTCYYPIENTELYNIN